MTSSSKIMPVILQGAPDVVNRKSGAETRTAQVMHLDMNNEMLEELLAAARKGKQTQIAFGRTPMLTFGSRSINLAHKPTKIRPEIYKMDSQESWSYAGNASHRLSVQKENDPSAGLDEALTMLKNNMASIEKEREARKTITPANQKTSSKAALQPLATHEPKQSSDSHRLSADWAIKQKIPAIRHALVHILAIGPATLQECSRKSCATQAAIEPILEKIANKNANEEWELGNKAYKDVHPWSFKYASEQRQSIVDKAIKAYDRLRIDPKDPVWQQLLPAEERNKGKVLSRLAFNSQSLTPSMTPKIVDKKLGLPKKTENKKSNDIKTKDKIQDRLSPHPHKNKNGQTKSNKIDSASPRDDARHASKKVSKAGQSPAHHSAKEVKPSMPAKALLNKPRNPSPLSKSPPVNASDFEDSHPVRRTFSAAPSPSRNGLNGSAKRKADDSFAERSRDSSSKKARVDALHHMTNMSRSSPAMKRKAEDHNRSSSSSSSDNTPLSLRRPMVKHNGDKARMSSSKLTSSTTAKSSKYALSNNRPRSDTRDQRQESDDSSVTSPDYALSHSKRLQLAEEFKRYYSKYKQFHIELSAHSEPPSKDQMSRLMVMHNRVAEMKKSLAA